MLICGPLTKLFCHVPWEPPYTYKYPRKGLDDPSTYDFTNDIMTNSSLNDLDILFRILATYA